MSLNVSNFRQEVSKFKLSKNAFNELLAAQDKRVPDALTHRFDVTPAPLDSPSSGALFEELGTVRNMIDHERHVLLIDGFKADTLARFKSLIWTFGSLLGVPMVQNHLGHHMIEVYDRGGKSIEEGARYHQTKQGAYVHNDGVSDPVPIDYLILACGQKALLGGESILIDASAVYVELTSFPEILEVLKGEFLFENRGMAEEEQLFKAPILSFSEQGIPHIRYCWF